MDAYNIVLFIISIFCLICALISFLDLLINFQEINVFYSLIFLTLSIFSAISII